MFPAEAPLHRFPDVAATGLSLVTGAVDATASALQGLAFWTAIPLPAVILGTLLTGVVVSVPAVVGCLVLLNVVCAVVGQSHTSRL